MGLITKRENNETIAAEWFQNMLGCKNIIG